MTTVMDLTRQRGLGTWCELTTAKARESGQVDDVDRAGLRAMADLLQAAIEGRLVVLGMEAASTRPGPAAQPLQMERGSSDKLWLELLRNTAVDLADGRTPPMGALTNLEAFSHDLAADGGATFSMAQATPRASLHTPVEAQAPLPPGVPVHRGEERAASLQGRAMEALSVGVAVTDIRGAIQYVNPAFVKRTGYSASRLRGLSISVLNSGSHPEAFFGEMWETILEGGIWRGRVVNRRWDGGEITDQLTITPLKEAEGLVTGFLSEHAEVAERPGSGGDLARRDQELEALNKQFQEHLARRDDLGADLIQMAGALDEAAKRLRRLAADDAFRR